MTTEASTIDCPMCGEEIKSIAKKCKHCGEMLEQAVAEALQPETKDCQACGEEIKFIAKKCKHCGEVLRGGSATTSTTAYNTKFGFLFSSEPGLFKLKPSYFILIIVAVCLIPFVIGFFIGLPLVIMQTLSIKHWKKFETSQGRSTFKAQIGKVVSS